MNFRIADTFTDSLAKLTSDEQKAVKTTAFDLQVDPSTPGMQLHRIEKAKDPNFWSVRLAAIFPVGAEPVRKAAEGHAQYGSEGKAD